MGSILRDSQTETMPSNFAHDDFDSFNRLSPLSVTPGDTSYGHIDHLAL